MRKLTSSDLRELKLLKHYRIIRKWVCKTCDLNDADLELLLYLEALDFLQKKILKLVLTLIAGITGAGTSC
jgi:hypothetical protein